MIVGFFHVELINTYNSVKLCGNRLAVTITLCLEVLFLLIPVPHL